MFKTKCRHRITRRILNVSSLDPSYVLKIVAFKRNMGAERNVAIRDCCIDGDEGGGSSNGDG